MSISVECPLCHSRIQVREEDRGKRGRCPKCNGVFSVPAPSDSNIPALSGGIQDGPERDRTGVVGVAPAPEPEPQTVASEGPSAEGEEDVYALAGAGPKKSRAARVRAGELPAVGANARGL